MSQNEIDSFAQIETHNEIVAQMVQGVDNYAIFLIDPNGIIRTWNDGAERIKGYRPDEIIGQNYSVLFPEEARAAHHPEKQLELALKNKRYAEQGWRVRKDGSQFWASIVLNPVFGKNGVLIGFSKVTEDLSLRREAERQQEMFELMIQNVKDYAIFMLDPDGVILSWNQGAQRINGYTGEEIIGKHFSVFYPEETKLAHPEEELEIAKAEGRYEEEGWRLRKDGSRFWANVVITRVTDKEGKFIGFAKVTRDLTERRETEIALKQSRDEAISANEVQGRFLSTISHEVRTPMSGIIGLVELLNDSAQNETSKLYSQTALDSCKRLLQILNNLLDTAKLQSNFVTLEHRDFAVRPIVGDVVQLASPEAAKRHLQIESSVSKKVPELVCGDEYRVRQILQNLVFNAVKFTENGKVSVSVEEVEGASVYPTLKFSVADTGIGITQEQQARIFEPFVQAEEATTRVYGGTGLGLNIARTLTELMGGEIGVSSKFGEGSIFWVVIPFRESQCESQQY